MQENNLHASKKSRMNASKASVMANFDLGSEKCMKEAFKAFDFDQDGLISPEDLHKVIQSFKSNSSLDVTLDMVAAVDNEGLGSVCFKDFCMMYI